MYFRPHAYLVFGWALRDDLCDESIEEALYLAEEACAVTFLDPPVFVVVVVHGCCWSGLVSAFLDDLPRLAAYRVDDVER